MTHGSGHAAVSLRQVDKYYGAYHALRSIDLEITPRERIVICGPSGSGKSTLIRCMNMLAVPDPGAVLIEGTRITEASQESVAALRAVGMVFQQFNLFPHKTVLENCTLAPVLLGGLSLPEAEARAISYLDKVRIGDQAEKGVTVFGEAAEVFGHQPHIGHHRRRIGKDLGTQPLEHQPGAVSQHHPPGVVDVAVTKRMQAVDPPVRKKKGQGEARVHGRNGVRRNDRQQPDTCGH